MQNFSFVLSKQGGNLMFAADCPTKRAAFMTDMTLGRRSHVPALWTSFLQFFGYGSRLSLQPDIRFFCTAFAI